jgi:type III pantothenate kinase
MILVVDVGNTNISFGVVDAEKNLTNTFSIKTERERTAFEFLTFLEINLKYFNINAQDITEVKIASVVPEIERELTKLFTEIYEKKLKFITPADIQIKINLANPLEVGVDRVLNVFSAFKIYGDENNILIIDFGTAITFDVGLKEGIYEGGIIFPGINLSLEALKNGTSKLPKVSLKEPTNPIGKSTAQAINSGIFYGYASMVNGIVSLLKKQYEFKIIITGGYANLFNKYFDFDFKSDNGLSLRGISLL